MRRFRWTTVDQERLTAIAVALDLELVEAWDSDSRHFAVLVTRA